MSTDDFDYEETMRSGNAISFFESLWGPPLRVRSSEHCARMSFADVPSPIEKLKEHTAVRLTIHMHWRSASDVVPRLLVFTGEMPNRVRFIVEAFRATHPLKYYVELALLPVLTPEQAEIADRECRFAAARVLLCIHPYGSSQLAEFVEQNSHYLRPGARPEPPGHLHAHMPWL